MTYTSMAQLKVVRSIIDEAAEVSSKPEKTIALSANGAVLAGCLARDPIIELISGIVRFCSMLFSSGRLRQEKEKLLQEALKSRDAVVEQLSKEVKSSKDRIKYLTALNRAMQDIIKDLKNDLGTDKNVGRLQYESNK